MPITSAPGQRRRTTLAVATIALVATVAYAPTLGHGFVFDDGPEVVDNVHIRSLASAPRVFSTASWAGSGGGEVPMYRPLTTLTYSINYATCGFAPFWFHLVNVILHGLVSLLVLALGIRLGLPLGGALAGAILFAVMPVHVEAVANVAGRKELLLAGFAIGAVLAHGQALRRGGLWLVAAPIAVLGALFSKESGLSVLGLIVAHDLVIGRSTWKENRRRALGLYSAYALASLGFVAARFAALGTLVFPGIPFDENPIASAPLGTRLMTAIAVLGRGLGLLLLPVRLSPDYSFAAIPPVTSPADPAFLVSLAVWAALVAAAIGYRRRFPIGLFALLWYALSLFPASNVAVPIGTIFGERLLYLPSVAFALVAGAGAAAGLGSRFRRATFAVGLTALVAYAARTVQYAGVWSDEVSLFAAATKAHPRSAKAQRMLGGALVEAGRTQEALQAFERAIDVLDRSDAPPARLSPALVELAVAFERLGRRADAEGLLLRVLQTDPSHPDALWRLGVVRWQQGQRGEAVALWRQALAANSSHARAMSDLGIAAQAEGNARVAEEMWRRAAAADPTLASPLYRLGNLYEREGRFPEARGAWMEFLARAHETYPEWRSEVAAKLRVSAAPR